MSKRKRPHKIPKKEFEIWASHQSGVSVQLAYSAWPSWAKDARDPNVDLILYCPIDTSPPGGDRPHKTPVGRLTVLREDEKDRGQGGPINKDLYYIYISPDSDDSVLQFGPYGKDKPDHWKTKIADEYTGWPVIS